MTQDENAARIIALTREAELAGQKAIDAHVACSSTQGRDTQALAAARAEYEARQREHDDALARRDELLKCAGGELVPGPLCDGARQWTYLSQQDGARNRRKKRAGTPFETEISDGQDAAHALLEFRSWLAGNPLVKVTRRAGKPASAAALASARRDPNTPEDVVDFCGVVDGIALRWRTRDGERLEGRIEVPSLREMRATKAGGIVLEDDDDSLSRTCRLVDSGCSGDFIPMCLEGDFGYWDDYNGCFQPDSSFSDYVRIGIDNLFAGEWQGAVFGEEPFGLSADAVRARVALGLPLSARCPGCPE